MRLRESPTGPFTEGTVTGQTLVWNNTTRQWSPGSSSGGGVTVYPLQSQLNWDTNDPSNVLELVPSGEPSGLYLIGWAITTAAVTPTLSLQGIVSFTAPDGAGAQTLEEFGMGINIIASVSAGFPQSRIGVIASSGASTITLEVLAGAGELVNLYAIATHLTP